MKRRTILILAAIALIAAAFSNANAAVVYTDIEDLSIPTFEWLDLDGNGSADIAFDWYYDDWYDDTTASALIPVGANEANGFAEASSLSLKLSAGDTIDGSLEYAGDTTMLSVYYDDWEWDYVRWGNWDNMGPDETAYLGFTFIGDDDQARYGWVQAHVDPNSLYLTVYDFAYESNAGVGIAAGDMGSPVPLPASFVLLATGVFPLAAFRKKLR